MAGRRIERVVWTEGMLMCPQHLQQQDLFFEGTLAARIAAVSPHDWGVARLTIDDGELSGGVLKVSEFAGVLSGGLPLSFGKSEPGGPPSRPIDEHFGATATSLEVFLAVPSAREGIPNYQDAVDDSATARYRTMNRPVPDLTIAKTEQIIGFGRPNVSIRFGGESREDFETLKIAEVVRGSGGGFALSNDFIPPALYVSGSRVLAGYVQDLLAAMLAKQRALSDARRQIDAAAVEFTSQDITRFLLLNALNGSIPVIRHIAENKQVSPLATYLALVQLAGQLTSFSSEIDPSSFPAFQYADLRATFGPLLDSINKMLGVLVRDRVIDVPLEPRPDGVWLGQLKEQRLLECPRFVLAVETDNPQQDTANRLPTLSKIASWKQIGPIVQGAMPGAKLTATHRPPPEVPVRPKLVYFLVDTTDRHWRQIVTERTVAIYLPPPFNPKNAKVTLMGIPERGRS